jgi:hypothetical protein
MHKIADKTISGKPSLRLALIGGIVTAAGNCDVGLQCVKRVYKCTLDWAGC